MNIIDANFSHINANIRRGAYHVLGSGSGRRVYDLGNGYVVKVAKNNKGIAQNRAEYLITLNNSSDIFAEVISISRDFIFLIMERASKINDLSCVRNYYHVKSNKELFQIRAIRDFYANNDLLLPDLYRPVNWGIIHGKPVIIDYGFTKQVRRKYYFI